MIRNVLLGGLMAVTSLTFTACGDDTDPAGPDAGNTDPDTDGMGGGEGFEGYAQADAVLDDFSANVVVATYAELATRLGALHTAAEALAADPSEANLTAAQDAWIAARVPWEASEGFLFGPVDTLGIDPALDTWPVDRTQLDDVLAADDELTPAYVGGLDAALRGFHTTEYLLFGEGQTRTVAELDARTLAYLTATTQLLADAGATLETSWTEGDPAYGDLFTTAGEAGNTTFPSRSSAAEEIVRGIIGIADEVANGKIADPFDQMDTTLVESQFSFNSLTDFQNNIRSIRNAYTGEVEFAGTSGASLSDYVASVDADLDARVITEIDAAITALGAIPAPFRDAVTNADAADEITAAQEAIRKVQTTFEQDVLPLVQ